MDDGAATAAERPRGHARRRAARRQAVDIVFQADITDTDPLQVIDEWKAARRRVPEYAEDVVRGVSERLREIDDQLGAHLEGWTVPRMAAVDRAILRVACYELLAGIPAAIAINEAVEAASELSTEDSGRFVNGVLGRIAREQGAPETG
ncbi:MAG TPA: transcription antitermination factor NusB [Actinomycetota bacterium]|nr:transcription antitermination factor NusB [Actinomycetota bacterium]